MTGLLDCPITNSGFSLRNEVAGEQCKVTGDGEGAREAHSPLGGCGGHAPTGNF